MSSHPTRPPWLARFMLRLMLGPGIVRESIIGDLQEEFDRRHRARSHSQASAWYWEEALSIGWYGMKSRLTPHRGTGEGPERGPSSLRAAIHGLITDLRHAWRALRHHPTPVGLSAVSLALGMAATATMISVVGAIDFRPLPFPDSDRLFQIQLVDTRDGDVTSASPGFLGHWQERTRSYRHVAAASVIVVALDDGEQTYNGARISDGFFAALGVVPILGRTITDEDARDAERVAVISHQVWQTAFGSDLNVVGRSIPLSWAGEYRGVATEPYTVIGVLPRGAEFPGGRHIWLPAWDRLAGSLTVVARLRPDITRSEAQAEMEGIGRQLASEYPDEYGRWRGTVTSLREAIRTSADDRSTSARLPLLLVAVLVLGLATVNASVVFLVRAARQEPQLAIRRALGASRSRLATYTLSQTLLVSVAAGAAGILLSLWGIGLADAKLAVSDTGPPPTLDWRVIAAAVSLAVGAGLAVGLVPIARLRHADARGAFFGRVGPGRRVVAVGRLQGALVTAQVAGALMLLSGAGVLTRDLVELESRDAGFDGDRLVAAMMPTSASLDDASATADRVAAHSGVVAAALGGLPAEGYAYRLERGDTLTGDDRPRSYRVNHAYFTTLDIPLLAGRTFDVTDRGGSAPVAIVSESAARAWWPSDVAVGQRVFMGGGSGEGEWVSIVGVTGDERVTRNLTRPVQPILYRPWGQLPHERRRIEIFVRTAGSPGPLIPEIRSLLRESQRGEGYQGGYVLPMNDILGIAVDRQRFRTSALTAFSAFALLLASIGVYGVVAAVVNQRKAEIGVRMALGAGARDVIGLVARRGVVFTGMGMIAGLAGAWAFTRVLEAMVVSEAAARFDVVTFTVASAVLAGVAFVAGYFPGRRALRISPSRALREADG